MNPKKGKTANEALRPFASLSMIPQSVNVYVCICFKCVRVCAYESRPRLVVFARHLIGQMFILC